MQRTFTVKRDAERFAVKVEVAKDAGDTTRSLVKNTATVSQVIAASMEAAKPRLKPRTFHSYELMYSARIIPEFGSRRVTSISRADVQAWINKLSGEGLAPATVHHCYVALRKVMKHALWDRRIAFNPCDGIDLPKAHDVDEGALAALTYAQVEAAAGQLALFKPYDVLVRFWRTRACALGRSRVCGFATSTSPRAMCRCGRPLSTSRGSGCSERRSRGGHLGTCLCSTAS